MSQPVLSLLKSSLLATAVACIASTAHAQQTQTAMAAGTANPGNTLAGLPQADPQVAVGEESGDKKWIMRTPLVDVPWPKVSMPKLNWKPMAGSNSGDASPGPLTRMSQATRNAAQKTRTAWNATIDKMKVGPFRSKPENESQPSFFARWFGPEEEAQPETVAEFIGQDRPQFR